MGIGVSEVTDLVGTSQGVGTSLVEGSESILGI